jgi:hypothetical protein
VPATSVKDAGFNSDVVAANVAPTGTIAVAPETSTQTSFGKYLNETIHAGKLEGTVMLVAPPAARVAEYFTVDGEGAYALYDCTSRPNWRGATIAIYIPFFYYSYKCT